MKLSLRQRGGGEGEMWEGVLFSTCFLPSTVLFLTDNKLS